MEEPTDISVRREKRLTRSMPFTRSRSFHREGAALHCAPNSTRPAPHSNGMPRPRSPKTVAEAIESIVGPDLPIAIETYDGGRIGPADAPATLVVRTPDALRRILTAPGERGRRG